MKRFVGKIAVVTGGGRGIGAAICHRLASEGASVVVVDIDGAMVKAVVSEIASKGEAARPWIADLGDANSCRQVITEALRTHGRVDVLVNNAGIIRRGELLALSDDDWRTTFAVNLDSMYHLCKAVLPSMIESGGGAIVNISSQWGLHPAPGNIAYNVSKAAVAAFTQNLARDYAPRKIRVNAVCPGEIYTAMVQEGLARSGRTLDEANRLVPFGRIGQPDEVAALVAFLASEEAPFMCGSLVEITGAQAVA
ncbi:SDR family NAD(P)-dependent oxidoreductase (plasmid) [Microvirga sp. RSM25]|uniref:SDR family NAD(P)-dependent oxidoreductase n=1 Tax=Microvirga sp. RSM25 TaxID=3273802 RepID=UPI00384E056A